MAVPKGKQSKSRTNSRFANYKATLVECPHCHSKMQAHRVCGNCGYYDKVEVVPQDAKKD